MEFLEDFQFIMENEEANEINNLINNERRLYKTHNRYHHKDIFDQYDNVDFIQRYRISKNSVLHLLTLLEAQLHCRTERNNPIPPLIQLLIALRLYASGSFYIAIGDFANIHKSTVYKIVSKVTIAICSLRPLAIQLPETLEEKSLTVQKFHSKARFPRVLGVLDGTHIRLHQCPGGPDAEIYRNRKGYFSLNVQVVADADCFIKDIVARWPGSAHDSNIFDNSHVHMLFENGTLGDYVLLGDSAYPNRKYLLTPLHTPQTDAETLYNEAHVRTRNIIKRTFGIWKRRFPILTLGMRYKIPLVQDVTVATAILHNIALKRNDPMPIDVLEIPINFDVIAPIVAHNNENDIVRRQIVHYFSTL